MKQEKEMGLMSSVLALRTVADVARWIHSRWEGMRHPFNEREIMSGIMMHEEP